MVRIRLRRVGGKKQASFRVVAADKESPRDGRFIEILGFYNPRTEPATIDLKEDRIYDWMSKGAQPSDSVQQIFQTIGLTDRFERFKSGEKVETLMAEALEAKEARKVNPKTRYPAPVGKPKKAKAEEPADAPAEEESPAEDSVEAKAAPKADAEKEESAAAAEDPVEEGKDEAAEEQAEEVPEAEEEAKDGAVEEEPAEENQDEEEAGD